MPEDLSLYLSLAALVLLTIPNMRTKPTKMITTERKKEERKEYFFSFVILEMLSKNS